MRANDGNFREYQCDTSEKAIPCHDEHGWKLLRNRNKSHQFVIIIQTRGKLMV